MSRESQKGIMYEAESSMATEVRHPHYENAKYSNQILCENAYEVCQIDFLNGPTSICTGVYVDLQLEYGQSVRYIKTVVL